MGDYVSGECSLAGTALNGISELGLNISDEEFRALADGSPDPGIAAVLASGVRCSLRTYDVKNAIANAAFAGTAISASGGFKAYLREIPANAIRTTGGYLFTMANGLMLPRRLSVSQGSEASMEFEAIGYNSSGTIPFTYASTTDALLSPTQNVAYTLGPVVINGATTLNLVQGWDLDFGIGESVSMGDGATWPKHAGIISRMPSIAIRTLDLSLGASILAGGYALSQIDFYLRRLTVGGGGTEAIGSSVHIKIACNVASMMSMSFGGRRATLGARVLPYKSGGTEQIVLTSDTAITLP